MKRNFSIITSQQIIKTNIPKYNPNIMTRISKCHQLPKSTIYTQRIFYWKLLIIVAVCLTPYVQSEHCEPANGKKQSPINIDYRRAKDVRLRKTRIDFSQEYSQPMPYSLVNTGNKIQVKALPENEMYVSGGIIQGSYKFRQLDIHLPGEHTFRNSSNVMEIQVVHEQTTNSSIDQYLIIGYYFKIGKHYPGLTKIIDAIPKIANKDESTKIQDLKLRDVIDVSLTIYFGYEGSLTSSPYTESVQWIMKDYFLRLSRKQVDVFYQAAMKTPGLVDNNRCVQDLNGRRVYRYRRTPVE